MKVPDARGLLTITAGPMTMNNEVSNNQMMQFYNKSKFIPNIILRVADKSIYQYPQKEITQNMSTPARDRLTPEQVPLFEQGLKALADKSGKSVAEVEELIKISCKDVHQVLQPILIENPSKYLLNIAIHQWDRLCIRRIYTKIKIRYIPCL